MPCVLDASVSACWAFSDEDHPVASIALDRLQTDQAYAPSLWWYEIRNILVVNERRGRISPADSGSFLRHVQGLGIRIVPPIDDDHAVTLARQHRLSVYDASYLGLAIRHAIPLATLDTQLARAAQAEGVALISAT